MANLFEKIQNVRKELQDIRIKMTGKNTYAGYEYFELSDFLKPLNELMAKYKMTAIPSFTSEVATLTAIDCENPEERFAITSPFSSASLKGCHEVQNIGAVETYQRRYLYQAMFDIAENDSINALQGRKDEVKGADKKQNCNTTARNTTKTDKNDLPFPDNGINEKKPNKDEIRARRQAEILEMQTLYYAEDVGFMKRLTAEINRKGKKISELEDGEYEALILKIKNKEI